MTKQELIKKLQISDQQLQEFKELVKEEIGEALSSLEDRIPDMFTIADDEEWNNLDLLARILFKEVVSEWGQNETRN